MRLSSLQKFILTECYNRKGRIRKKVLLAFYDKQKEKPSAKDQLDTLTKSVESLIDKGLMVGYGVRTPKKWYIEEVRLMPRGRNVARKLCGEQQVLPLHGRKRSDTIVAGPDNKAGRCYGAGNA